MEGIEFNPIAIMVGGGDFVDGAIVAEMIKAGVVEFVEGDEAVPESGWGLPGGLGF